MQVKVSFPGGDDSAELYMTDASHSHKSLLPSDGESETTKFTWKSQPEAAEIVINGLKHNNYPSQIMKSFNEIILCAI